MGTDRLRLSPQVRFRAVDKEGVIIHTQRGVVIVVNSLGLRIMELIREHGCRQGVLDRLIDEYDAPESILSTDLDDFLARLREQALVESIP